MTALAVRGLSKHFGGVQAVADLHFDVEEGQIFAVIGPNGAGKTTLFNLITGMIRPSDGKICFRDRDITLLPPHKLAALGIARTFQNLQIFNNMTVAENVMVGRHRFANRWLLPTMLRLPPVTRSDTACRSAAIDYLEFIGFDADPDAPADSLPYGALKRLEIARALAVEPRLLLLDEPAAGCNERETREIKELIGRIAGLGITVLLVEHDMRLVMGISDHVLVLDYGKKLTEGTPAIVRKNPNVIAAYLGRDATEETKVA